MPGLEIIPYNDLGALEERLKVLQGWAGLSLRASFSCTSLMLSEVNLPHMHTHRDLYRHHMHDYNNHIRH